MSTFALAFLIVAAAFAAMALGVLLGREPIKGSCGGLGNGCGRCRRDCPRRANNTGQD